MKRFKYPILIGLFLITVVSVHQIVRSGDNKLHIIFCDVGQGDGMYIRTPSGKEVIVDGGPDDAILACLDRYRPFWDRSIDLIILSHPHYDHFRGLIEVLARYHIGSVIQESLINNSDAYNVFSEAVSQERSVIKTVKRNNSIDFADGILISVMGPDDAFLQTENPEGITEKDNPPSLILHLQYADFDLLLAGDSDGEDLIKFIPNNFKPEILHLPHHGSMNGYTNEVSKRLKPDIAVISSGKNNSYGHPHQSVLDDLKKNRVTVLRTDTLGDIHLIIDRYGMITIEDK